MPREADLHEVQRLLGQGAQLVDVMERWEFESSHILGAVHIPLRAGYRGTEPARHQSSRDHAQARRPP